MSLRVLKGNPWIDRNGRKRPLCRQCHAQATWAAQSVVPSTVIRRDGNTSMRSAYGHAFYCDAHIELADRTAL